MPSLAQVAKQLGLSATGDAELTGAALSSRHIRPGYLFIAAPGKNSHGLDHLQQAIELGAVALLSDKSGDFGLPTILAKAPRSLAGEVSAEIFATPKTGLLGVTGTNGKTSTTTYLHRLMKALDSKTGLIGGSGICIAGNWQKSELTTPEAPRIHQLLSDMRSAGDAKAVIEVSAQAIERGRIAGLEFDMVGFTNLSRDHLDDYQSMEKYFETKAELFAENWSRRAVINVEDEWGKQLYEQAAIPKVGIGADLEYQLTYSNDQLELSGKQSLAAAVNLTPTMAKNLGLALVMLLESGVAPDALLVALSKIELQVSGRLERVSTAPAVYVDYAHTPAGVEAAVRDLRASHKSLIVVLGASGNRDKGKRSLMAHATSGSRLVIVTDQHPRDEDPAAIRAELTAALAAAEQEFVEISDPAEAIRTAIERAGKDEAVLWCGPGNLDYREIKGEKVPFNALEIARGLVQR